jgi:hypothetical protein
MGWRAYFEAAVFAGGSFSQNEPVALGAFAPSADAKEADDVLVDPVKECEADPDRKDHNQRADHGIDHGRSPGASANRNT